MFIFPKSSFVEMSSLDSTKQERCNFCSEKMYHPNFHGCIWECNACAAWVHQSCMSLKDRGDSCSCGCVSFSIVTHASYNPNCSSFVFITQPSPIPSWSAHCGRDIERMMNSGPNPNSDLQCHNGSSWLPLPPPHRTFCPSAGCGCHTFGCQKCDAVSRDHGLDWSLSFCAGRDRASRVVPISAAPAELDCSDFGHHSQLARANVWNPIINPDAHLAVCGCSKQSKLHLLCPKPTVTSLASPFSMRQTLDPNFDPIAQKIAHLTRIGKAPAAEAEMKRWFGSSIGFECGCSRKCLDPLTCQLVKAVSPTSVNFAGHIWICKCWPPCSFGLCDRPHLVPRSAVLVRTEDGLCHRPPQQAVKHFNKRKPASATPSSRKKKPRVTFTPVSSSKQSKITTFFSPPTISGSTVSPPSMRLAEFDNTPFKHHVEALRLRHPGCTAATPLEHFQQKTWHHENDFC